ncbi:MAG: hypothetical protein ACM3NQ_22780 [Bacteroidales bacterium]
MLVLTVLLAAAVSAVSARPSAPTVSPAAPPESATRYYAMTAHVRPFLIWMTREDVGGARISWEGAQGADESLELLIGSDPERAPMAINRWGFVSERTLGGTTQLTGLMTETDEQSIDAARTNAAAMGANHMFRSIRATVCDGEATSVVSRVAAADFTYRQYQTLLDRLPAMGNPGPTKRIRVGPDTEPGFLIAVRRMVHASVSDWQATGRVEAPARLRFVYAGNLFELALTQAAVVKDAVVNDRNYGQAIEGQFQIRNLVTASLTPFTMLFAATGTDTETPLRIVYRPRWWVELELRLVDPRASRNAFAFRIGSRQ